MLARSAFTLDSLIAWLETQRSEEGFNYSDPYKCMLAQYFRAAGYRVQGVIAHRLYANGEMFELLEEFEQVARAGKTFGEALKRARELQAAEAAEAAA